jgi:hypothetical protein
MTKKQLLRQLAKYPNDSEIKVWCGHRDMEELVDVLFDPYTEHIEFHTSGSQQSAEEAYIENRKQNGKPL